MISKIFNTQIINILFNNKQNTTKMLIFVTIAQQNTMSIVYFSQRLKNSVKRLEKPFVKDYTTLVLEKSTAEKSVYAGIL